jgi:hypothetical protein
VVPVQQGVGLLMVEMEVEVPLVVVITVLEVQHMTINIFDAMFPFSDPVWYNIDVPLV